MTDVFISHLAAAEVKEYLAKDHNIIEVPDGAGLDPRIASHADLFYCAAPWGMTELKHVCGDYPGHASGCAVVLDKYLIHRLDITAPELLSLAEEYGLMSVNVRQGYTKCSCVVVDGNAVITADNGILEALSLTNVKTFTVKTGHVLLNGYPYGFLGGASGRVGNEVIFHGDLSAHPDFNGIVKFIEERGLGVKYFPSFPLTDIGSIIEKTR